MEIARVLSSTAKFEVLNVLYNDPSPLRIREVERRTGLAIRSVQVALDGLVEAKVVIRKKQENSPVYRLNDAHESYDLLNSIFKAVELDRVSRRSRSYNLKAQKTFQFIAEATAILQRARS